jgi:hypothetical protein
MLLEISVALGIASVFCSSAERRSESCSEEVGYCCLGGAFAFFCAFFFRFELFASLTLLRIPSFGLGQVLSLFSCFNKGRHLVYNSTCLIGAKPYRSQTCFGIDIIGLLVSI